MDDRLPDRRVALLFLGPVDETARIVRRDGAQRRRRERLPAFGRWTSPSTRSDSTRAGRLRGSPDSGDGPPGGAGSAMGRELVVGGDAEPGTRWRGARHGAERASAAEVDGVVVARTVGPKEGDRRAFWTACTRASRQGGAGRRCRGALTRRPRSPSSGRVGLSSVDNVETTPAASRSRPACGGHRAITA